MKNIEQAFVVIHSDGIVEGCAFTPTENETPNDFFTSAIQSLLRTFRIGYVPCDNELLHAYGIGTDGETPMDFLAFYAYDGGEINDLADAIVPEDLLPKADDGYTGMVGDVVLVWATDIGDGQCVVSGYSPEIAQSIIPRLVALINQEVNVA